MSHIEQHTTEQDVVTAYKRYAPLYDWMFGKVLQPGREAIVREIHAIQPENILEIGVGTGILLPMYPKNIPVTGVDISEAMLKKAQQKIPRGWESRICLLEVSGENLPFENQQFSCVVLPYIYSVTPNPEKLIAEARRVCRIGGSIIIANHFSGFESRWRQLEKFAKPFAKKIGFNSDFPYDVYVEHIDWNVVKSYPVNLFDLSRIVVINNQ